MGPQADAAQHLRSRGYGLLEIALGIAVAALIIAGSMMYFMNASQDRKAKESLELMMAIQVTISNLYSGRPDVTGLTTAQVARSKQLPTRFITANGAGLRHPFGARVDIQTVQVNGATRAKTIFTQVPFDACVRIATKYSGAHEFIVNNSATPENPSPTDTRLDTNGKAMTAEQASRACSTSNSNRVAWVY